MYAGGEVSPGPGTVIKYGNYMFFAGLDYESFLNHDHELYLTSNGVVLAYVDVAPMSLTFHYRPPHEKDPEGLKSEKKQHGREKEAGTAATESEGSTRYAYQHGDTVHGKVEECAWR